MFNFLGIATQTEVARAAGVGLQRQGGAIAGLSPGLAIGIGTLVGLVTLPALPAAARFMSADAALDGSRRRTVRLTPTYVYWSEFVDNERNIYRAPRCGCP